MIEKYVDAEELRRLLSTLVVVVGALAIAGLFAITIVPGLRNANRPETPMPVNPTVGEPGWLNPAEFPPEKGREIPPVDPKTLIEPTQALIARGKDLFTRNCQSCHGENGKGKGPGAAVMNPPPRDFTAAAGWKNGFDLPAVYGTLNTGIPGSSMASFNYLTKRDRMALAHYVRSFGSFTSAAAKPEAMAALSKELAAPGEKTPNKIPVSMAMKRLEQEFTPAAPLTAAPEDHSPGAEAIRRVVKDPARAAQALAGSAVWLAGPKELAAGILAGVPGNGFSVSSESLSPADWTALFGELTRRFKR